MKVGVIGAGIVGSTVSIKLHAQGHEIAGVNSRRESSAARLAKIVGSEVRTAQQVIEQSEIILVATPDRVIAPLVRELSPFFHRGQAAIHFSGSLPSAVMAPARLQGAKVLSIHPLQSFASVEMALASLQGTHFAVEGDDLELGFRLVQDLGGIPHCYQAQGKTLYHAGACVASNYLVVLAEIAVSLLEGAGFKREDAVESLLPLMRGTLANLEKVGLPASLTGPIARGDYPVVSEHLNQMPDHISEIYSQLGLWAVEIAQAKGGLPEENKEILVKLLGKYKPVSRKITGRKMRRTS